MAQGGLAKFLVKRVPSPASPAAALQMSNCESSQPAAGSSSAAALQSTKPDARRPRTAKNVTNAKGGKTKLLDVPDKKKKKDKDMMNEAPADDHCDDFEPLTSDGDMQGAVKEKGTEEQNNDDLLSVCGFAVGEVDYQVAPVPGIMDTTDHEMTDAKMPQAPMNDTYDAEINMWNDALEQKVPLRSAAGLRFARSETGGKSILYKGSRSEKEQFRVDWAKSQLDRVARSKEKVTSLTNTSLEGGTYMTLRQIVDAEKDETSALAWVAMCEARGGEYVLGSEHVIGRVTYWYKQTQRFSKKDDSWSMRESQVSEGTHEDFETASSSKPRGRTASAQQSSCVQEKDAVDKDKEGARGKRAHPRKGTHQAAKRVSGLTSAIASAMRVKAKFQESLAMASALSDSVAHDDEWSWANSLAIISDFDKAKSNLTDGRSPVARMILASDAKIVKASFEGKDEKVVKEKLTAFEVEVSTLMTSMNHEIQTLRSMHEGRLRQKRLQQKSTS